MDIWFHLSSCLDFQAYPSLSLDKWTSFSSIKREYSRLGAVVLSRSPKHQCSWRNLRAFETKHNTSLTLNDSPRSFNIFFEVVFGRFPHCDSPWRRIKQSLKNQSIRKDDDTAFDSWIDDRHNDANVNLRWQNDVFVTRTRPFFAWFRVIARHSNKHKWHLSWLNFSKKYN